MKKVIAAAAGLMLVGAMVSTASAAVSFGGDARARWYYEKYSDANVNGDDAMEEDEKFSSRVRVKVNADSKGGAYARARIRMADATWDGTRQTRNRGAGTNSYVDYAYIGVPIGPVTLEAGLINTNITPFFYWDRRDDAAILKWSNDMTAVQFWFVKQAEFTDPATDTVDDNDINAYVGYLNQKFAADWAMTLAGVYVDDATPADASGFTGSAQFAGPAGPVALQAELAYQEGDLVGSDDDGYGGYLQGGMNFGATSVTLNGGFTKDGYEADDDFGFIMIGGASAITPSFQANVGQSGDTVWLGGIAGFKASEALSLKGILVYADIDDVGELFEVSGAVNYAISDGASFEWVIGYLNTDLDGLEDEESPFGTAVTFEVSY